MSKNRRRSVAPTSALDHALESLAAGDPDQTLRWAVPALADEGSGAAAADIVGRALARIGRKETAVEAHRLAVDLLTAQGLVPHAVAAALAVRELAGDDAPLASVARAFGADATPGGTVRMPSLHSEEVVVLEATIARDALVTAAKTALDNAPRAPVGVRPPAQNHPLWSALPTAAFERFARALTVRVCAAKDGLITEGEPGHAAFVVARGEVRVTRDVGGSRVELAVIGAGGIVGEMALVTEAPRAATVTATRGALLLEAPRDALNDAAREVPAVGEQVIAFCRRRLIENVFRTSPVLHEVPQTERDGLAQRFETRTYEPGDVLIEEASAGTGLHLIAAGQVEVTRAEAGGERLRIALLDPGNCVGEISMVLRRPATASVIAVQPTVSLLLDADQFVEVVRDSPNLLHRLYDLAVQRDDDLRSVIGQEAEEIDDAVMV